MRWFNLLVPVMALAACVAVLAQTPTYNLGRTPSEEEIRLWDAMGSIGPEGKGLPPGKGTPEEGAKVYAKYCAFCHGLTGEEISDTNYGGRPTRLLDNKELGDKGKGMIQEWPLATMLWEHIRSSMPRSSGFDGIRIMEGVLSVDELYAVTAWLLYRIGVIQETDVMDEKTLPKVQMPKRFPHWKFPAGDPPRPPPVGAQQMSPSGEGG